jgi:4-aminobutyrate aminotransferase-like enzyme
LLLHPSGPAGSRLVFLPPLNASESEVETATELFDSALRRLQSV